MDGTKLMKPILASRKWIRSLACILIIFYLGISSIAFSAELDINIPGQKADNALRAFAKQTGFSLMYSFVDVNDVTTEAISGKYSPMDALRIMLKGSGLIYELIGEDTVSIKKTTAPATNSTISEAAKPSVLPTHNGESEAREKQATNKSKNKFDNEYEFDEMIVTASKRPRKLQEVPISIYALTGQQMENNGITNMKDIGDTVAGLEIINNGTGNVVFAARGVTTLSQSLESTSSVGYYLDESPFSSVIQSMPEIGMWDMERIEVLRGPQGTLFGEGSMGGTIRIIANKPDSTEFSSKVGAEYSSTESGGMNSSLKSMVNIPISQDKLALRVVASYSDQDGWIDVPDLNKEDVNENTSLAGRIATRWTPNEKLTVDGSIVLQDQDTTHLKGETTRGKFLPQEEIPFAGPVGRLETNDIGYTVCNLTLDYDFSFASLISATSFFDYEMEGIAADYSPLGFLFFGGGPGSTGYNKSDYTVNLWSQELRLVSNGDEQLDWTVGALYKSNVIEWNSKSYAHVVNFMGSGTIVDDYFDTIQESKVTAYAVFADADYELTDTFSIGAGLRYYEDEREYETIIPSGSLFLGPARSFTVEGEDSAFSPKLTLNWKPADGIIAFANVARGFRSGGTNISAVQFPGIGVPESYDPETLWSYEVGIKTNVWSGITLNAYLYYNDWEDMHLLTFASNGFTSYTDNVGSARSYGCEIEMFATLPIDGWTANFSGAYTNSEITEDATSAGGALVAKKGNAIPFSPEFKFNVSTQYSRPLTNTLFGTIRASYTYRTETYSNVDNAEVTKNEAYDQVNTSIGVESETWSIFLFADNLFDSDDTVNKITPIPGQPYNYSTFVRPRTIGLRFTASF